MCTLGNRAGQAFLGERRITDGPCQISVHLPLFLSNFSTHTKKKHPREQLIHNIFRFTFPLSWSHLNVHMHAHTERTHTLYLHVCHSNTHSPDHARTSVEPLERWQTHTDTQKHCAAGHSGYGLLLRSVLAKETMPGNLDHARFNGSQWHTRVWMPDFKGPIELRVW